MIRGEGGLSWHNRGPVPIVASRLALAPLPAVALVGVGDPSSTRLVYAMVIGLVAIGVVLILLGVWILRQTKPDLEVLAPLERMGDGDWKKKDTSTQRRMLDELRPEGAHPLTPATRPPSIDRDFEQADHPVTSFSDLGPGVGAEQRDPTPTGAEIDVGLETDADSDADESEDRPHDEPDESGESEDRPHDQPDESGESGESDESDESDDRPHDESDDRPHDESDESDDAVSDSIG